MASTPKAARLDNLDFLRGLAAFLVLAGHLRAYIFQSFGELEQAALLTKAFYFATGLGHQSVIIFFALSGFLVGGKAIEDITSGRFVWSRYLLRRLTRLWIVILPALFLTLLFDSVGLWMTNGRGYDGRYYEVYSSGPHAPLGIDLSLQSFLGNMAFLQTIYVPSFGSNGPMWSLANEFWYYIIFPLAAWVAMARIAVPTRLAGLCILLFIVGILPMWLLAPGVIWVAGAVAAWSTRQVALTAFLNHVATRIAGVTLLLAALFLSRIPTVQVSDLMGDVMLGIAVALALPILATLPSPGGIYRAVARASSELSYTLYLTHFPLLTFVILTGLAPNRLPPSVFSAGLYVSLMLAATVWAAVVWWCFERNTDRVYSWLARNWLSAPKPAT